MQILTKENFKQTRIRDGINAILTLDLIHLLTQIIFWPQYASFDL